MTTGDVELLRLRDQVAQVERDLDELDQQAAAGELDPDTASRLRATYLEELDSARAALGAAAVGPPAAVPRRSRARLAVGAGLLVLALAVAVGMAGALVQDRDDGPLQGVAAADGGFDPSQYSNETMEAVIAANADDPAVADQLPFMRFALAERYFTEGDHSRAFPHYQAIIEGDPEPRLASAALTRVAWIVWTGNGESDLAVSLLDRALELTPGDGEALYVKGQVVWCGLGRPEEAAGLFEQVLEVEGLGEDVVGRVEADLAAAVAGEPCSS